MFLNKSKQQMKLSSFCPLFPIFKTSNTYFVLGRFLLVAPNRLSIFVIT